MLQSKRKNKFSQYDGERSRHTMKYSEYPKKPNKPTKTKFGVAAFDI